MIDVEKAKRIVSLTTEIKGLRYALHSMLNGQMGAGSMSVMIYERNGQSNKHSISSDRVARIARGYIVADYELQIAQIVRELNQLGAEIPK